MVHKQTSDLDTNNKPDGSRNIKETKRIGIIFTIKISDTYKLCYDLEPNSPDCMVSFIFNGTQCDVMLMIGDKAVQC